MIYLFEINGAIEKIEKAGGKVTTEEYVILASPTTEFNPGIYPLPILVGDRVQAGVAFIARRSDVSETQPPIKITGRIESE